MLRIGLLLTGNGALDGSDPLQAVAWRIAIAQRDHLALALAPDALQHDVVGPQGVVAETRHALAESMRLASGVVARIGDVKATDLDALVVPGGLGAVKTLCTAAVSDPVDVAPAPATLARDLVARGGVLAVVDEATVWAAWTFADGGLALATDGRAEITADLERNGHRALAGHELVRDDTGRVVSRWLPADADAAIVFERTREMLEALEAELAPDAPR